MDPDEPRANLSLQTIEMVDVEAVAALRDMSELESESIDVRFAPGEEEVDINEPQGQPLFHDVHPLVQVELHNCNNIGNQPPNNGAELDPDDSEHTQLLHSNTCSDCQNHQQNLDSVYPDHNIIWNDIKHKLKLLVRKKSCAISSTTGLVTFMVIIILASIVTYEGARVRHFNSQCLHVPSSTEVLIAQNSTVILLNTTEYYMSGRQNCYEPNIVIKTEYLVNVSVVPCENLQYSDCIPISRTSLEYTNAKNPLPVVFDENHSPNYLVNGHINVTVNISTSKFNPLTPEYIYFCLYTDYDQFESVRSKSSKSYWKKYRGKQCSRQQLDSNGDATILKNTFKITRLEYVFIDFGSTVDPLDSFQFNVNGFGQMLLYPTRSSFIKESCDLSDGQDSCKLALNLAHNSEAMCIIGYRQRDRSGVPFGELTVTLSTKIDNKFRICIMIVCAVLTSIGILFLLALCVVQICNCRKVFKSDSVVSEGPSSVQASEGENPPS